MEKRHFISDLQAANDPNLLYPKHNLVNSAKTQTDILNLLAPKHSRDKQKVGNECSMDLTATDPYMFAIKEQKVKFNKLFILDIQR